MSVADADQDKLAEEWAAALSKDEAAGGDAAAAKPAGEDALADEWAAALADQEAEGIKKEKEQEFLKTKTKPAPLKDMTQEAKAPRPEGAARYLDFILDIPLEV